jgi:hypothetical protein
MRDRFVNAEIDGRKKRAAPRRRRPGRIGEDRDAIVTV